MEGVLCQLDMDPWGTPYRTTISKIARKVSTVGLHVNKIQKIVSELFDLRSTEQIREANDYSTAKYTANFSLHNEDQQTKHQFERIAIIKT